MQKYILALYHAHLAGALSRVRVFFESSGWNMTLTDKEYPDNIKSVQKLIDKLANGENVKEDDIFINYKNAEVHLVDKLAHIIFSYEGGVYPEEYHSIFGKEKLLWETDYKHSTNNKALSESTKDEYRCQARKIIEYLKENGLLNV